MQSITVRGLFALSNFGSPRTLSTIQVNFPSNRSPKEAVAASTAKSDITVLARTDNKRYNKPRVTQLANFNKPQLSSGKPFNFSVAVAIIKVQGTNEKVPSIQQKKKQQEEIDPQYRKIKHSKWFMHCQRLQSKVLKEVTGDQRLMRPKKLMEEDGDEILMKEERKKRKPNSRLLSELVGVQEKGKLAKPSLNDPRVVARRMDRMGDRVRQELVNEISSNRVLGFEYDPTEGRPQIVDVIMSSDLKRAKVIWAPPLLKNRSEDYVDNAIKEWAIKFERTRGYFRSVLASRIRTRFVPLLEFRLDTGEYDDDGEDDFAEDKEVIEEGNNEENSLHETSLKSEDKLGDLGKLSVGPVLKTEDEDRTRVEKTDDSEHHANEEVVTEPKKLRSAIRLKRKEQK